MYPRLLEFLRCPKCRGSLVLDPLSRSSVESEEVALGLLHCPGEHWYPVVGGIPRMLPDALEEHWPVLSGLVGSSSSGQVRSLADRRAGNAGQDYDRRTRANYSLEWDHHEIGDRTWSMELEDRVQWFFIDPIRIPKEQLAGKVMLDAGCGNGSQSVAYTEVGLEVVAIDLSSGVEKGYAFRQRRPGARPDRVHFVQGDLQHPPLAAGTFDIIHSAGVLQATSDTEQTFRGLCPLLKPGGSFYVWVLKYESIVTPVVNSIRALTTRVTPPTFAKVAGVMAVPFMGFCRALDALGIRKYPPMSVREAKLGLMDIFGSPYAHYHSYEELSGWYRSEGFVDMWPCNHDRRGFGICGRRPPDRPDDGQRNDTSVQGTQSSTSPGALPGLSLDQGNEVIAQAQRPTNAEVSGVAVDPVVPTVGGT
jgi:ubiquinone/menaquinone biosynthesis C-methylase UbiE/uncharacterized protein YbaR (Trm112 family)